MSAPKYPKILEEWLKRPLYSDILSPYAFKEYLLS